MYLKSVHKEMVQFPWEKESSCFLRRLTPEDNRAVCQKRGNRYERLTLKHGWFYIVCCTRQLIL